MQSAVDSLTIHADLPLLMLALLVGVIGFVSCVVLVGRAVQHSAGVGWTLLLGGTLALCFWSTHFIALLGHRSGDIDRYGLRPALLALLIGLLVIGAGTGVATRWRSCLSGRLAGGALAGLGIVVSSLIGARALLVPGVAAYPPSDALIPPGLIIVALSAIAFTLLFGPRRRGSALAAVVTLLLAAVSAHTLGAGSLSDAVNAAGVDGARAGAGGAGTASTEGAGLTRELFSVVVTLMALKVLLAGAAAAFIAGHGARRMTHQAHHDALTGLPNRQRFRHVAGRHIERAGPSSTRPALLTLDLDDFKPVNDVHGHAAGDALVHAIAQRIAALVGEHDTPARMGGDEFTLLLHDSDHHAATDMAMRLQTAIGAPVRIGDERVHVGASIGIAQYPDHGTDIDTLMRNADTAMYRAKARGKNRIMRFEPAMQVELAARQRLEARLQLALQNDSLHLQYQPLVSSAQRHPVCMEALLRWHDEELGPVSPDDFIPVAESSGLIVPIGDFVLERACRDAASWPHAVRVAVNLSVVQFVRGDPCESVRRALQLSGLPAHRLELEITESLSLDEDRSNQDTITALRRLGVKIAMDDFGTGYSSLDYLQRFGFDKLKIDRSFVSSLDARNPQAVGLVRAAISMGRNLGMRVVAEGVETAEQARVLTELDCDELQGYLIARPMPSGAVEVFLLGRTTELDLALS